MKSDHALRRIPLSAILHPLSSLVRRRRGIGRDGAEADDIFDAVGHGHVEPRHLPFGHEDKKTGREKRRSGNKHIDQPFVGTAGEHFILVAGGKADRV